MIENRVGCQYGMKTTTTDPGHASFPNNAVKSWTLEIPIMGIHGSQGFDLEFVGKNSKRYGESKETKGNISGNLRESKGNLSESNHWKGSFCGRGIP